MTTLDSPRSLPQVICSLLSTINLLLAIPRSSLVLLKIPFFSKKFINIILIQSVRRLQRQMRHLSVTTEQRVIFFLVFILERNMPNPRFCTSPKKKKSLVTERHWELTDLLEPREEGSTTGATIAPLLCLPDAREGYSLPSFLFTRK